MLLATPSWPKPPAAGDKHSAKWVAKANRFAEFALTVFWPWPKPGTKNRFRHVDRDGKPCQAFEEFHWRLDLLAEAPQIYNDEEARIKL
jgi:hypothetical protein